MLSVIIPSCFDPYLQKTIDSILENAEGKIEVIPILDGFSPNPPLKTDKRVKPITFQVNQGMRAAINAGLGKGRGKYIMKCDSHCIFGPGFDKVLIKYCDYDTLMIPRRYSINEDKWTRNLNRPIRDYHYFTYPMETKYGINLSVIEWDERTAKRMNPKYDIDDTMTFQGSCWFAHKNYFKKQVGILDDRKNTYGAFPAEMIEIGMKYWLGGGNIKANKKTWYGHLQKRPHHYNARIYSRSYKKNADTANNYYWLTKHWMNNEEPGMIHPISWLVEKFWPVPSWPEDRKLWIFPKDR